MYVHHVNSSMLCLFVNEEIKNDMIIYVSITIQIIVLIYIYPITPHMYITYPDIIDRARHTRVGSRDQRRRWGHGAKRLGARGQKIVDGAKKE